MFSELIVVTVTPFSGSSSTDKNGISPVMLQCLAGIMPNRNVLSGTVAQRGGFEVGKTYLAQVREAGYDTIFGADFNFVKVKELETGTDIANTIAEIGKPQVFTVQRPEGFDEQYHRKTDRVIGQKRMRTEEGLYIPVSKSDSNLVPDLRSLGLTNEGSESETEAMLKESDSQKYGAQTEHENSGTGESDTEKLFGPGKNPRDKQQ